MPSTKGNVSDAINEMGVEKKKKKASGAEYNLPLADSWNALKPPLSQESLKALKDVRFTRMTPVQAQTIPALLTHKDVVVEAITGSGKTLAFLIPVLEMLWREKETPARTNHLRALIISPTRELATQIHSVFESLQSAFPSCCFIGGSKASVADHYKKYRDKRPSVVVATPGRLAGLVDNYPDLALRSVELLVLDEADRLLGLGFEGVILRILRLCPKQRRTGLFSATMTDALENLVKVGLRNPVRIVVKTTNLKTGESWRTPESLKIYHLEVKLGLKVRALVELLRKHKDKKTIVYFSACAVVAYFSAILPRLLTESWDDDVVMTKAEKSSLRMGAGPKGAEANEENGERGTLFTVLPLHGRLSSQKRDRVFSSFSDNRGGCVLLATDLASRGLDIPSVDLVIHFDAPKDPRNFAHRCGRSARMGASGVAIAMLTRDEDTYVPFLEMRRVPVVTYTEPLDLSGVDAMTEKIRSLLREDREKYLMSLKALVSHVRAYASHELQLVFRMKKLNIVELSRSYGLLHVPKMPEVYTQLESKHNKSCSAEPIKAPIFDNTISFDSIPYLDKALEKQRQRQLKEKALQGPSEAELRKMKRKEKEEKKENKMKRAADDENQKRRQIMDQWERNLKKLREEEKRTDSQLSLFPSFQRE